jgi:hypothetical protein
VGLKCAVANTGANQHRLAPRRRYVAQHGITTEKAYAYTAATGTCKPFTPVANVSSYVRLPKNNYSALMNAVANIGPIAISAAAEPWQMCVDASHPLPPTSHLPPPTSHLPPPTSERSSKEQLHPLIY